MSLVHRRPLNESLFQLCHDHFSLQPLSERCGWWLDERDVEDWHRAQKALTLPTSIRTIRYILVATTWRKHAQVYTMGSTAVRFVPCEKCASEEMSARLRQWVDHRGQPDRSHTTASPTCTIGWVRHPMLRFVSAYREFEWRFAEGLQRHGTAGDLHRAAQFHRHALGTTERVVALVRDFVSLRPWHASPHALPPALLHRGALPHLFPFAGSMRGYVYDFLGDLAHFDEHLHAMRNVCRMDDFDVFSNVGALHPSSVDPQNLTGAASAALARIDVHAALSHVYRRDFEIYNQSGRMRVDLRYADRR